MWGLVWFVTKLTQQANGTVRKYPNSSDTIVMTAYTHGTTGSLLAIVSDLGTVRRTSYNMNELYVKNLRR